MLPDLNIRLIHALGCAVKPKAICSFLNRLPLCFIIDMSKTHTLSNNVLCKSVLCPFNGCVESLKPHVF